MTNSIPPGPRAAALRRELGPVAWCALECLAERSVDGRTAEVSVRSLAAELGVAKNTAHRAIVALRRAGLIEADQRRDRTGRYQPGCYLLHLDELTVTPDPSTPRSRPRCRTTGIDDAQLSLLPGA